MSTPGAAVLQQPARYAHMTFAGSLQYRICVPRAALPVVAVVCSMPVLCAVARAAMSAYLPAAHWYATVVQSSPLSWVLTGREDANVELNSVIFEVYVMTLLRSKSMYIVSCWVLTVVFSHSLITGAINEQDPT
jgi:hypothetical protein